MLIPDINSIHEIVPPLVIGGISNRELPPEEQLYFSIRGMSSLDQDALDIQAADEDKGREMKICLENRQRRTYDQVRKKLVGIHNYRLPTGDGQYRTVTEFDDFCRVAPPELVTWLFVTIRSGESLSAAERKNFLRGSVSVSISPTKEPANGPAPTATSANGASATATTETPSASQ